MKTLNLHIAVLILLFSLTGCAQNNPSNTISVDEFKEKINLNDDSFIVLDVRTLAELNGPLGKIEGAVHIPVQELDRRYRELDKYKDKIIAVICRTQNRSSAAAEFLREKGFNAVCVYGGMMEYSRK
jgi:rhodanese-related sulfurtransferase